MHTNRREDGMNDLQLSGLFFDKDRALSSCLEPALLSDAVSLGRYARLVPCLLTLELATVRRHQPELWDWSEDWYITTTPTIGGIEGLGEPGINRLRGL